MPANAAARVDAENRLAAAEQAALELFAEQKDAELAAKAAKAELAAAVLNVVAAEAADIAGQILDLESKAFQPRQRLGCEYS